MDILGQTAIWVAPWLAGGIIAAWRARGSRHLADESDIPPINPPLVTIIIPARNEAHNIERCVRSILASTYPALESIVVDDHSADGTGALARSLAAQDARLTVMDAPPLPAGWFGKSWACAAGAAASHGTCICFTDADTVHAPELITRLVNAQQRLNADLVSIAGRQEVDTFWERVVQPVVFSVLSTRYGGTERINRSDKVYDKIANGQCIFVRRRAYDDIGGHAAVRDKVAEDLMLAQRFFTSGKRGVVLLGLPYLSTRMYTSLREIVGGWRKNIFAGSRDTLPRAVPRWIIPVLLVLPLVAILIPPIATMLVLVGVAHISLLPPLAATAVLVAGWAVIYSVFQLSPLYALTYPLGATVVLYIIIGAIIRGQRVAWKDREYISA